MVSGQTFFISEAQPENVPIFFCCMKILTRRFTFVACPPLWPITNDRVCYGDTPDTQTSGMISTP